jgi:hypothetical protein
VVLLEDQYPPTDGHWKLRRRGGFESLEDLCSLGILEISRQSSESKDYIGHHLKAVRLPLVPLHVFS